jgi:phosphomannomutase
VVLRPSGTEPKIKCYIEITETATGRSLAAARAAATARLAPLRAALQALLAAGSPPGRHYSRMRRATGPRAW